MRGCGRDSTSSGNSPGDRRDCRSAWLRDRRLWLCVCTPLLGWSLIWLIFVGDFEFGGLGLGFFFCVVGVFDLGIFVEREKRKGNESEM